MRLEVVSPLFKGGAHRACPERPFSAAFCVAAAKRPPANSASLLEWRTRPRSPNEIDYQFLTEGPSLTLGMTALSRGMS